MLMNAELSHRVKYEILMLEKARKEYAYRLNQLRDYEYAYLRRARPGKRNYYYYIKKRGSKKYNYLGICGQQEVAKVREAKFLKEAIRRIDRNIALMRSLADDSLPYDPSHVCESLPAIYRCEVPPVSELYQHEGKKWLEGRLEFQKRFPENYPARKRQTASDEVKLKTISELVVYEKFKDAGLFLVYELPLPMSDYGPPLYPDFTILSPVDMKTEIIVEFAGRLDRQDYREDFAKRIGRYIARGFVPGVNLFFIFGDNDGNIDSTQITKVISDIFCMTNAQVA